MTAVLNALPWDVIVQARNVFYWASAFLIIVISALLLSVPEAAFPPYWPMRALWSAAAGEAYGGHLVIGTIVPGLALFLAAWLFDRRLLQRP